MRSLILLSSAIALAAPVFAQTPFPRLPLRPNAWASLSVGLYNLGDIYDPESDAVWDFGNIFQFRGTLERELQRGTSFGIAGTLARPLAPPLLGQVLPVLTAVIAVGAVLGVVRIWRQQASSFLDQS